MPCEGIRASVFIAYCATLAAGLVLTNHYCWGSALMNSEDVFVIRALLVRMKMEAANPRIDRMSDEIMTLISGSSPMPVMQAPDITWRGDTMVVR